MPAVGYGGGGFAGGAAMRGGGMGAGGMAGGGAMAGGAMGGVGGGAGVGCGGCGCEVQAGPAMMSYVGGGCGDYTQETTYKYVGLGAGEFGMVAPKTINYTCIFIGGGLAVLVLVLVLVLLLIPGPTTTTTPLTTALPYNCNTFDNPDMWSLAKKTYCCANGGKGCAPVLKMCTLWGDPHVISFDQMDTDKSKAYSFYGDGDFWLVKSSTVSIQARFEGTKYTE